MWLQHRPNKEKSRGGKTHQNCQKFAWGILLTRVCWYARVNHLKSTSGSARRQNTTRENVELLYGQTKNRTHSSFNRRMGRSTIQKQQSKPLMNYISEEEVELFPVCGTWAVVWVTYEMKRPNVHQHGGVRLFPVRRLILALLNNQQERHPVERLGMKQVLYGGGSDWYPFKKKNTTKQQCWRTTAVTEKIRPE